MTITNDRSVVGSGVRSTASLELESLSSRELSNPDGNPVNSDSSHVSSRDLEYEEAYHYAQDIEATSYLVSTVSQQSSMNFNPLETLIRMVGLNDDYIHVGNDADKATNRN